MSLVLNKIFAKDHIDDSVCGRFWNKVDVLEPDQCWLWKGALGRKGYGSFNVSRAFGTKIAHRVSYLIANGELDKDLLVCHSCDTPSCVNPNHLWQGTAKQNSEDMVAKGRSCKGSRQGSTTLSEKDVIAIRSCLGTGRFQQEELSKKFMVSQQTISRINNQIDWRHV